MKIRIFLIAFLVGFCGDPGFISKEPMKIIFGNPGQRDSLKILASLIHLISRAEKSIECTFSELDTGYSLDLKPKSGSVQNSEQDLAQTILKKRNEGIPVSIIFDVDKKCVSNGALFFQYPDFFWENSFLQNNHLGAYKHKDVIKDCNLIASDIPLNILSGVKQNGLIENQEIFFVNSTGKMSDNVCVIDKKLIWYSQGSLVDPYITRQAFAFILDIGDHPIIEEFTKEIEMFKNGLTGSLKKPYQLIKEYNVHGSVWHIVHGPQDKPLEYLAGAIGSSETLHMYSSGFQFDLQNPVVNSLINFIQIKNNANLLFSNTGIFSSTSFVQGLFLSGKYCLNNPYFCEKHLKYFDIPYGPEHQHIFLIKDKNGHKKTLLFNGDLNKPGINYADSMVIDIESDDIYNAVLGGWNSLSEKAQGTIVMYPPPVLPNPGDVTITEIVWMGSVDNLENTHPADEAIEIYNRTKNTIDIGGLAIACTNSLIGDIASSLFVIPPGVVLGPEKYFTIASRQDGAFSNANMIVPEVVIGNTTRECLLIDNRTPSSSFYPTGSTNGHYNDLRLKGIILDQVLDYTQDSWNFYASQFFSKTGLNTVRYNIEGEGVRSMEKISIGADGRFLKSWHMNTLEPIQNNAPAEYIYHTYTTFGYENSSSPQLSDGSVVVSEIHWMGSYDSFNISNASDEFIEIYNRAQYPQNIGGWIFGCSTDLTGAVGKPLFGIPFGTLIRPGQYLTIQKLGAMAFSNVDYSLDFTLNNTITQCIFTDANFSETLFLGSDSNGNGLMEGHFDHPLFSGFVADVISDRSGSFSSLGMGLNDTLNKKRRSCERINVYIPGDNPSNWKSNSISDPAINIDVNIDYRANTFATPGRTNSF